MNELVGARVDVGRGFVDEDEAAVPQQSPRDAHELLFPHRQIVARRRNGRVQSVALGEGCVDSALLQRFEQTRVGVFCARVEILSESAFD